MTNQATLLATSANLASASANAYRGDTAEGMCRVHTYAAEAHDNVRTYGGLDPEGSEYAFHRFQANFHLEIVQAWR